MNAMITVSQIDSAFQTIIGWPYVSPGFNNQNGIDCSGAFVYAYQKYGKSIYHGSNRIIRAYCKNPFTVTKLNQLEPGMTILKSRADLSQLPNEYKPGGQYYNPQLPHDYYHIGLVVSVNPLQIINATTPVARVDTNLSLWSTAGYLNAVDYTGGTPTPTPPPEPPPEPDPAPDPTPVPGTAITVAPTGKTVNLRKSASTTSVVLVRVPLGERVQVLAGYDAVWWKVKYQNMTGYMMREFLQGVG